MSASFASARAGAELGAAPQPVSPAPVGWVLRREPDEPPTLRIWGLTPEERLLRSLERAGCSSVRGVTRSELPDTDRPVVAVCSDVVLDERIVQGLVQAPGTLLVCDELGAVGLHAAGNGAAVLAGLLADGADAARLESAGLHRATPQELAPAYVAKLRKRDPPYAFAARPDRVSVAEARIFDASYKGLTDLVTKWVWPRPAATVTRWCARRGVRPNTVTLWSWVLAIAATVLFGVGAFLPGLAVAWLMTFLDTVDGKLARVTLTSSRLGDVLDHGLDLVHPPFWWLAWGMGLGGGYALETSVVVGGYLVGRLLEGAFLASFGFETHSWRPIDGVFRTITARRNPNLILLSVGALAGRPDLGFAMVAIWTLASLAFHGERLVQAMLRRRSGVEIAPWEGT